MTIPTETRLLPQIHGRTNPFKRLAAAVISQAVRDATRQMGRDRKSATTWLLQNDDGFPFWCNVLGMDPDQIRQELSVFVGFPNESDAMSIFSLSYNQHHRITERCWLICRAANSDRLVRQVDYQNPIYKIPELLRNQSANL